MSGFTQLWVGALNSALGGGGGNVIVAGAGTGTQIGYLGNPDTGTVAYGSCNPVEITNAPVPKSIYGVRTTTAGTFIFNLWGATPEDFFVSVTVRSPDDAAWFTPRTFNQIDASYTPNDASSPPIPSWSWAGVTPQWTVGKVYVLSFTFPVAP